MKFRAHETFFIRKGWLSKGLRNVIADPYVFMGANGNPMDILGIGSNMVKSLRYWMQVVGLTIEPRTGKRKQILSPLGEIINRYDKYIEETGTLWLLHYRLVSNIDDATSWYFFFNEFKLTEFTKDDFIVYINNHIRMAGQEVSERSLEDDYNCIVNTYVPRIKSNPEKVQAESNIDCPLGELRLLDLVNKKDKKYKKCIPMINSIDPLILLAVIIDQAGESKEVKISTIQNEPCNAGKVFNLDIISLTNLLHKIELRWYIKVDRTAGLDIVRILTDMNFENCVTEYYRILGD